MKKYKLKFPSSGHPAGTIVYEPKGWDYGLANDDSRMTGEKHVSVTLNLDGDYPTFTIPECFLEEIKCTTPQKSTDTN